jgi:hypothetical protein
MAKAPNKVREDARRLFLTGESSSNAEIALRLRLKPHTVGEWRRQEDWDGLKIQVEKRAAEKLVERLANERVSLNTSHFKLWSVVVSELLKVLKSDGSEEKVKMLERVSAILDRAQKGQRLARGLSVDGKTEEQIQAEAAANTHKLVDLFLDLVKTEIPDPELRDRLARAVLEWVPPDASEVKPEGGN